MKIIKNFGITVCLLTVFSGISFCQSGYMDNALNYSMLIKEKTAEGVYRQISIYKVIGTPYLFGEKNKGDLFTSEAKAYNISLSYNTYSQDVEFYSTANPDKPLIKEAGAVDSFIIHDNVSLGITHPLKFIYGTYLGSAEKAYYLELYAGKKFSVYKKYKSDLGYVSTNYVQSELRQFDLLYEYYYTDATKPGVKKLKANAYNIIKDLKSIKDISPVFTDDDFTKDQEAALRKAFEYLNQ